MKKVCILGGGASALMCACFAPSNVKITILEQNTKLGKKILSTGNGRCNLSNVYMNKCSYNQDVSNYLCRFNQQSTVQFFNSIGLETYADDQGRVYPFSNTAVSVLDVLKNYVMAKQNVQVKTGASFVALEKDENGFKVHDQNGFEHFDNVVVALGNSANLDMFNKFNVQTRQFVPSLCALYAKVNKSLAGVRVSNVELACKSVGFSERGEVLFKQDGISGIVVFNLSAHLARRNCFNAEVCIDFAPDIAEADLLNKLKNRQKILNNTENYHFLDGFFNNLLNIDLLTRAKIDVNKNASCLSVQDLTNLCSVIKCYKVQTHGAQNNNQVASGGVVLSDLDCNLQSKKTKGLYFIGEIVDVDGVCGGYNLQWAWTSGKIVGESL